MSKWRKYDSVEPGQVFPEEPAEFFVDAETVRRFRGIMVDTALDGEPLASDDGVVPPMLAAVYIRPALNALKGPPGGVHAKQSFRFCCPVRLGDELSTRLEVMEKYERRGRRYLVCETRTSNRHGTLVTVGRIVLIWGNEDE